MSKHQRTPQLAAAILGAALPFATASSARAAEDDPVAEKVEHGAVNWTDKTVMATGSGAPDMSLPNVAAIRLAAERAAKVSAYRNILEAIKGVRITAKQLAGDKLGQTQIKTQVQGLVSGCKTVETKYFSDYGVDVAVKCNLDGGLAMVLAPPESHKPFQTAGERKYTGLIVDAVGLKAKPALAPRILETDGTAFYTQDVVRPKLLREHGAAVYFRSVEAAKKAPRLGDNPIVVRATSLGAAASDVRISSDDLERLKAENLWFLLEGRVAIATDGP